LSAIADAIAKAKEGIDVLIDDFKYSRDALNLTIQERLDSFAGIESKIETMGFELGQETDEKKATSKQAFLDLEINKLNGLRVDNKNDERI
jgi:hypothetical protein